MRRVHVGCKWKKGCGGGDMISDKASREKIEEHRSKFYYGKKEASPCVGKLSALKVNSKREMHQFAFENREGKKKKTTPSKKVKGREGFIRILFSNIFSLKKFLNAARLCVCVCV